MEKSQEFGTAFEAQTDTLNVPLVSRGEKGGFLQADLVRFTTDWSRWSVPLAVFTGTLIIGLLLQRWLFRLIRKWSTASSTALDDLAVEVIRQPSTLWLVMLAVHLATQSSELPQRYAGLVSRVLLVLWIASLTVVAARVASLAVRRYGTRFHSGLQVTSLTENIARIAVVVLGGLILMNELGVSITPILTASGVGGLAVALALQDTLSNFFAGFYIMMAGHGVDITWTCKFWH